MFQRRVLILMLLFAVGFGALLARLAFLQILHAEEYRAESDRIISHLTQVPPLRGRILDRKGRVLAEDRPSFDLWLAPVRRVRDEGRRRMVSALPPLEPTRMLRLAASAGEARRWEEQLTVGELESASPAVAALAELTGRPARTLAREVLDSLLSRQNDSIWALSRPRPCLADIGWTAFCAVEADRRANGEESVFAAFETRVGTKRVYPAGELMGHITGYVGPLSPEEYAYLWGHWEGDEVVGAHDRIGEFFLLDPEGVEREIIALRTRVHRGQVKRVKGYLRNDTVGRAGVEMAYNQHLRGHHRWRRVRLDRPDPGGPLVFEEVTGGGEASDGQDLVLTIDLDMQRRVQEVLERNLERLARENGRPYNGVVVLMDPRTGAIRALVSVPGYDPNTFGREYAHLLADPRKPLIHRAIAGQYPPGSVFKPIVAQAALQEGLIREGTSFTCQHVIEIGPYAYHCLGWHGPIQVADALRVSCNIFFYKTGERLGPRRIYDWAWRFGLGRPTGIDIAGEASGELPLAARTGRGWTLGNTYHFSIGQGPMTVTPLQIASVFAAIANGGRLVRPHVHADPALDTPRGEVALDAGALALVREGLWRVVQAGGTGRRAAMPEIDLAGKSGTAQWHSRKPDHAWFASYAPFDAPEVVCVVFIPEGELGGTTCAPIVREVLRIYFDLPEEEAHG